MTRFLCFALAAAAPAILAVAILAGSTPDEEEFRFAILASTMHVHTLAEGSWAWWTSSLGLGIPLPLVPNFHMHPLVPLLTAVSPVTWARLFYLAHTILGAIGMWQLGRAVSLTRLTNAACVFSFLLATPTQNYLLSDFWPTHYLVWTSAPWLLLFAWRFLAASGRDLWRRSLLLGVVAGIVLANTNPGHVIVYGTVTLAIVAARWRAVVPRWRGAVLVAALALTISSPNHVQLALERMIFDEDLEIMKMRNPLPPSAAWDVFFRPLGRSEEPWQADVTARGTRTLFFGGPFAVLALAGVWIGRRRYPDLVLGILVSACLLFTAFVPITFASRFHFRDPLTLCAIPLAGLALDALLRSRRTRPIGAILFVVQIGVISGAAWPFLAVTIAGDAKHARWIRGATADTPLVDGLLALISRPGRLVYSPQVDSEISARTRVFDGLGVNALAYREVSVVNGSFKGVSTDMLWPDDRLFYGRIHTPAGLVESDGSLDVLGIRYVLANPGERVAPGLIERGTVPKQDNTRLVLYENDDAWPGAFVIRGDAMNVEELPRYHGCSHDRLLCRDLGVLAAQRLPLMIALVRHGDRIDVALDRDTSSRLLILAEMFRPAWRATVAGVKQTPISVGPGLLGVNVPADSTSVQFEYRPTLLRTINVVAWSVLIGALTVLLLLSRPDRHRKPLTDIV